MAILFTFTKSNFDTSDRTPEQEKNIKDQFIMYAEEQTEIHYKVENQLQVVRGRKNASGMKRSLYQQTIGKLNVSNSKPSSEIQAGEQDEQGGFWTS